MSVFDNHNVSHNTGKQNNVRSHTFSARKRHAEEEASLREVLTSISGELFRLAERLLSIVETERKASRNVSAVTPRSLPTYVVIQLSGRKPPRFQESTTIPTFLEWEKLCVCRIPKDTLAAFGSSNGSMEKLCYLFAGPFLDYLRRECGSSNVVFRTNSSLTLETDGESNTTYLDVLAVDSSSSVIDPFHSLQGLLSKHFVHRRASVLIETTVAYEFPCALSRQTSLIDTEIIPNKQDSGHQQSLNETNKLSLEGSTFP
jgi:hypothetical protein